MSLENPKTVVVHGAESLALSSDRVDLRVALQGAQMAPVDFRFDGGSASPYSLAPWEPSECAEGTPELLKILRGDFFCMPFGESECTPFPHGAVANETWTLKERASDRLVLEIEPSDIGGGVVRNISIRDGQCAVYQEHTVSGVSGEFNYGNHPILRFPDEAGSCLIGTSPFRFGQVYTGLFEDPADAAYSSLQQGGQFDSLERVPLATGGYTDLTVYPARTGFEDLVMMSNPELYLGWTAVTMPGYVWLTLKSPKQFPSTIFWLSNAGRHRPPWNGRHRCRMGIEEVCSYFHEGVESSRERKLAAEGIPTVAEFSADVPTVLRNIQAVHPVEGSFGKVERIEPDDAGIKVTLIGSSGARVDIPLDWTFLE